MLFRSLLSRTRPPLSQFRIPLDPRHNPWDRTFYGIWTGLGPDPVGPQIFEDNAAAMTAVGQAARHGYRDAQLWLYRPEAPGVLAVRLRFFGRDGHRGGGVLAEYPGHQGPFSSGPFYPEGAPS